MWKRIVQAGLLEGLHNSSTFWSLMPTISSSLFRRMLQSNCICQVSLLLPLLLLLFLITGPSAAAWGGSRWSQMRAISTQHTCYLSWAERRHRRQIVAQGTADAAGSTAPRFTCPDGPPVHHLFNLPAQSSSAQDDKTSDLIGSSVQVFLSQLFWFC